MAAFYHPPISKLLPKVDRLIEDAFQHIQEYAVPYFEKVMLAQACATS
jgi:hypothetical protein